MGVDMTVDMDMDIDMGVDMGVICPCTSYAMAPPHSTARRRSRAQPEGGEVRRGVDAARLVKLEIGSVVSGQWSGPGPGSGLDVQQSPCLQERVERQLSSAEPGVEER